MLETRLDDATTRAKADAVVEARPAQPIDPNYQYWREHGHEWADEYDARKTEQPYYHIQELMLTEYIAHHAPARVLEFGCGVGRHLRNLSRLPGIDAHGYDQSAAMAGECRRWAAQDWIDAHITVGAPTGRLPYEDGAFDIVYTAEVLVHVRPEHLPGVLSELIRIARFQVFHLETSPTYELVSNEHDGCWYHDLAAAYASIGRACDRLPQGYAAHAPYRVLTDPRAERFCWPEARLALYRRMEKDLCRGLDLMRGDRAGWRDKAREHERRAAELEQQRSQAAEQLALLARRLEEVAAAGEAAAAQRDAAFAESAALRRDLELAAAATLDAQRQAARAHAQAAARLAALSRELDAERAKAWRAAAAQSAFVGKAGRYLRK